MMEQGDEARQQDGSSSGEQRGPTHGGETTGAGMLQQSAAPGATAQFGGSNAGDGQDQQNQRGVSGAGARPPQELLKETAEDLKREGGEVARAATRQVQNVAEQQKSAASSY